MQAIEVAQVHRKPTVDEVMASFLASCRTESTRDAYTRAIREYAQTGMTLSRPCLHQYVRQMQDAGISASLICQRLAALRKLAMELADNGLLSAEDAIAISKVQGVPKQGRRLGRWLGRERVLDLLKGVDRTKRLGRRDSAILALMLGGGLRRAESCAVRVDQLQEREGRWLLVDLQRKHHRTGSVPLPGWAAARLHEWIESEGLTEGPILRNAAGHAITPNGLYRLVIDITGVTPHDLRRTFGALYKRAGGDWESLRDIFGHADLRTTQGYVQPALSLEHHALDGLE